MASNQLASRYFFNLLLLPVDQIGIICALSTLGALCRPILVTIPVQRAIASGIENDKLSHAKKELPVFYFRFPGLLPVS